MVGSTTTKGWHYLIIALVAIGFIDRLIQSPLSIIVPLFIIGVVVYLYKFPPRWLIRMSGTSRPYISANRKPNKGKSLKKKKRPFRVIDGNKKKML